MRGDKQALTRVGVSVPQFWELTYMLLVVLGAFKVSNFFSLQVACKPSAGRTTSHVFSLFPTAISDDSWWVCNKYWLACSQSWPKGEVSLCLNGLRRFSCTPNFLSLQSSGLQHKSARNESVIAHSTNHPEALGNQGLPGPGHGSYDHFSSIRPDGEMRDSKLQNVEIKGSG